MNFQNIPKIEDYQFYLDVAFSQSRERVKLKEIDLKKKARKNMLKFKKFKEDLRLKSVEKYLQRHLRKILESFPVLNDLPEFYHELVRATIDFEFFKKSLGGVNWAIKKVHVMTEFYLKKIFKTLDLQKIDSMRKEYYGRISSIMKQIKDPLKFLDEARKVMRKFPAVKTSLPTVSIFGFPNVGKTTLLYKLTGSKPEINSYSFTTKTLNIGYILGNKKKMQIIDTPGTLNRFERMNDIEKQAYLSLKYCSDAVVYVFDLTEPYSLEDQKKLYESLKQMRKEILVYVSKCDILTPDQKKGYEKYYMDPLKLKKKILGLNIEKK